MTRTRRRALVIGTVIGLVACLPVAAVATLPASAWRHAVERLATGGSEQRAAVPGGSWTKPVRITGTVRGDLSPGVTARIDLSFSNPNPYAVKVQRVRVNLVRILAPEDDTEHACTTADFDIRQMSQATELQLPAGKVVSLADLGVRRSERPHLTMLNRPVNQDGCKRATLRLRYRAGTQVH